MFLSKYVQFRVICSLQYSININTIKVDPHSDWLQNGVVKPKNTYKRLYDTYLTWKGRKFALEAKFGALSKKKINEMWV